MANDRNIDVFRADVVGDDYGVYAAGCETLLPCDHVKSGVYRMTTGLYEDECGARIGAGTELPLNSTSPAPSVIAVKVKVPDKGYMFVSKTSYDAGVLSCNNCCGVALDA